MPPGFVFNFWSGGVGGFVEPFFCLGCSAICFFQSWMQVVQTGMTFCIGLVKFEQFKFFIIFAFIPQSKQCPVESCALMLYLLMG